MAKIGTAHVEIKPVLNEDALDALVQRIEDAIAAGVGRALNESTRRGPHDTPTVISPAARELSDTILASRVAYDATRNCPCRPENGGSGVCGCTLGGPQVTC